MSETTTPQGVIWACQDCTFAAVNGEDNDDRPADLPEVWALDPGADVTPGLTWSEHDDPAECEAAFRDGGDQCECEHRTFSSSACDACGSTLGGDRHAFTLLGLARPLACHVGRPAHYPPFTPMRGKAK